ncbi:hypothetical protein ACHAQH_005896 [Verticillium albo-atrum]
MELHTSDFNPPVRKGVHTTKVRGATNVAGTSAQARDDDAGGRQDSAEKDVAITMRDGVKLYANVLRPLSDVVQQTPSIVLFSPFGKHGGIPVRLFQNMGVDFDALSSHTLWEISDPIVWCGQHGYSLVVVDARGTWWSEGDAAYYFSPEEGRDGYDIVEWIAEQSWSTGKVGRGAVSYYAVSIYQMAVLRPPHLAAIMACVPFQHFWMSMTGNGLGMNENAAAMPLEQPTFTRLWASKVADWAKIDVPAFSVTGWSSLSLHLRGTIAAWKAFRSKNK